MLDLKTIIKKDVGRRQRGMRIRPGDFFLRGSRPVEIVGRDSGLVRFLDMMSGDEIEMKHALFISLSLDRIKYTGRQPHDLLRTAWGYASAKTVSFKDRARIVRSYLKSTDNKDDAEVLKSWLFALNNEMEPRK